MFTSTLEEVRLLKEQEQDQTRYLRQIIPQLETPYMKLLEEWEIAFTEMVRQAGEKATKDCRSGNDELTDQASENGIPIDRYIHLANEQSNEFVVHLRQLKADSYVIEANPEACEAIDQVIHGTWYINHFAGGDRERAIYNNHKINNDLNNNHDNDFDNHNNHDHAHDNRIGHDNPSDQDNPGDSLHSLLTGEGAWSNPVGLDSVKLKPVPIGKHTLPPLPYPYKALEPHIDEQTMRIHHDKHHQSYVDGLNTAEKKLQEARENNDFDLVKHWERELAFNGAGHYLHTIFWSIMSPMGGGLPSGPIAEQIREDFGSFDAFKRQFSMAAEKVEGGGWAILVWSPRSHRLEILQAEKHQNLSQWDVIPLLVFDVWEHAYYLRYQNKRADYIKNWWEVVKWQHVNDRFEQAKKLMWTPY